MKFTTKICILSAIVLASVSCAKHDFFDENTVTGNVGPESYWEVASAAVSAGGEMEFTAQYYSTVAQISHSEVWYDIVETIDQTVSCPWTVTFSYSQSSNTTTQKRISQLIKSYPHLEEYWSDSLHAYSFTGAFPVSGTLSPFVWSKPAEFDSTKMISYFGENYMADFKEAVHKKMQFKDYRAMYVGMGLMDNFALYTDSVLDTNAGEGVYKYFFPQDTIDGEIVVKPWVMDSINHYWENITFEQLIENAAEGCYAVDYNRSYSINAILRVYDDRGVYGRTVSKEIVIN